MEKASFDVADNKLVPKVGSCVECPFNAANQGNLFGEGKMVCTKAACFETKKSKSFLKLIEKSKKENILLISEIRQYWADDENNQLIISQLEKQGLKVYLLDDVEIIENPIEPTIKAIQKEYQHYDYSEDELKAELDEAMHNYKEALEKFNSAKEDEFKNGIVFHPDSFQYKEIFVKLLKNQRKILLNIRHHWPTEKWRIVHPKNKSLKSTKGKSARNKLRTTSSLKKWFR